MPAGRIIAMVAGVLLILGGLGGAALGVGGLVLTAQRHDAYVTGWPHLRRVRGANLAVAAPEEQSFWLASATGAGRVQLDWTVTDGRFTVVLASADGRPGIAADIRSGTRIRAFAPLGIGLLVGDVLVIVGAIALAPARPTRLGRPPRPVPAMVHP
jgi:hypothetical protein